MTCWRTPAPTGRGRSCSGVTTAAGPAPGKYEACVSDAASLRKAGLSLGCGVIAVLDDETCAVDEAARVAAWFAANSAGQCGACTWGLRDLAHATGDLAAWRPGFCLA